MQRKKITIILPVGGKAVNVDRSALLVKADPGFVLVLEYKVKSFRHCISCYFPTIQLYNSTTVFQMILFGQAFKRAQKVKKWRFSSFMSCRT